MDDSFRLGRPREGNGWWFEGFGWVKGLNPCTFPAIGGKDRPSGSSLVVRLGTLLRNIITRTSSNRGPPHTPTSRQTGRRPQRLVQPLELIHPRRHLRRDLSLVSLRLPSSRISPRTPPAPQSRPRSRRTSPPSPALASSASAVAARARPSRAISESLAAAATSPSRGAPPPLQPRLFRVVIAPPRDAPARPRLRRARVRRRDRLLGAYPGREPIRRRVIWSTSAHDWDDDASRVPAMKSGRPGGAAATEPVARRPATVRLDAPLASNVSARRARVGVVRRQRLSGLDGSWKTGRGKTVVDPGWRRWVLVARGWFVRGRGGRLTPEEGLRLLGESPSLAARAGTGSELTHSPRAGR